MSKNILILIPTLFGGGAERVAANLSNYLSSQGCLVTIALFDNSTKPDYEFSGELIDLQLPAVKNYFYKVLQFLKRIKRIKQLKKNKNIHTTISFLEAANHVNLLSKVNDQVIISIRDFFSKNHQGILKYIYTVFIFLFYNRKADKIITVSQELKNDLIKNYLIKNSLIEVIYNSYNLELIRSKSSEPLESRYQDLFNQDIFINSGRLDHKKGQDYLIRIFSKYKKITNSKEKLVILGTGELHDELIRLAQEQNLKIWTFQGKETINSNYDIYLLGHQRNPYQFLARSKLFLFPSLWEGFPNALVEAMICGLPVIAADCSSGPREILAPNLLDQKTLPCITENGVLLPSFYNQKNIPDTINLWAESIRQIFTNPNLNFQGQKRVLAFNCHDLNKKWLKLISR